MSRPKCPEDFETTLSGQTEIEQQQVKRYAPQHRVCRLAIVNPIDCEAIPLQARADRFTNHRVVLD